MEKNLKFIFVVLLIASTIFLGTTIALFFMRQAEVEKNILLEKKVDELGKEKSRLSRDLDEAVMLKAELETQMGALQEKAKSLEVQLGSEKKSRELIYAQLENEKKESKKLIDDMMKIRGEKEEIALKLAQVKGDYEALKTQLFTVQQAKEVMENKVKELLAKNEVELEKIVVRPEPPAENMEMPEPQNPEPVPADVSQKNFSPGNEIKGDVMVVNKKFDFVVVNLGENVNLRPGANLRAYRNNRFLTTLQVEKVHANMAAAKIPSESKNVDIREGDTVVVVQ